MTGILNSFISKQNLVVTIIQFRGFFYDLGEWQTDPAIISQLFIDHFNNLFQSTCSQHLDKILLIMESCVTAAMNDTLLRPFTHTDVEKALSQMSATKSPGVDDMPTLFYQCYWSLVGDDVSNICLQILNGNGSVRSFNHTLISLIP